MTDRIRDALMKLIGAVDGAMGDSDLPPVDGEPDSLLMQAMQGAWKALDTTAATPATEGVTDQMVEDVETAISFHADRKSGALWIIKRKEAMAALLRLRAALAVRSKGEGENARTK